jgi:hypothetical protein
VEQVAVDVVLVAVEVVELALTEGVRLADDVIDFVELALIEGVKLAELEIVDKVDDATVALAITLGEPLTELDKVDETTDLHAFC